jgi:excisionase family DNA binding protein
MKTKRERREKAGTQKLRNERAQGSGCKLQVAEAIADRLLHTDEVAQRLGVTPRTVALWVKLGKIPGYRLGGVLRFDWAKVKAHLDATCQSVQDLTVDDGGEL